ncbi:Glycosyl transferase family 14 [Arabidopsis suecica]|uniref:Glycosyl transferase family 14 n=1 Tax=Arabidopsis suecica TaxID=45249 RepID=A0A8T2DFN4_ARASU|nr:Glycosyl transferase family 14 [Arabidopsis suecica]
MLALYFILLVCVPLGVIMTVTSPRLAITVAVTQPAVLVLQNSNNALTSPRVITSQPLDHDELLLRQASKANPNPSPKFPKKLAFMFLTTNSLPLAPLWELFFNQSSHHKSLYNVYVHVDPTQKHKPGSYGTFHNRIIPSSKPAYRHTPTLISAARRLLAHALLDDPSNYMFILLSPSCIPLHSFNFTYKTLVSSTKSFIEILKDEPGWYERWAARGPYAMFPEVPPEEFRIGSQFWTLTRAHAQLVVSDVEIWSKFNKSCVRKDICYPEEHYFPTLLNMRDPQGTVSAAVTHVDWSVNEHGHPRTYKPSEVRAGLIKKLRSARPRYGDGNRTRKDPFLFARKFSPAGINQLMDITRSVIFNDSALV